MINPSALKTVLQGADPQIQRTSDLGTLVQQIRSRHPGGVNFILIGLASGNSFKTMPGTVGIIAVLIGLLLPAVQKVVAANSADMRLLQSAVKPGGTIGFVMGDGSVREAQTGKRLMDCEGYAF